MKRVLVALLLLAALSSPAFPQNRRARNRGRRPAAERQAPNRSMAGVNVRGNTVRFSPAWEVVKGSDGNTYARKKKTSNIVLAVRCKCSLPGGSCFAQSSSDSSLECRGSATCAGGECSMITEWVEPKRLDDIGLP